MVVERLIGLRNYIEGGIPLDATVTYDLMATIFQPGSPLHDGATIVRAIAWPPPRVFCRCR